MKYSLVINAKGPKPSDFAVYLTDAKEHIDKDASWFAVGRLQSVHFNASSDNFIPKVSGSFVGVSISKCDEPDLSGGFNVFYSGFAMINDENQRALTELYIRKGYDVIGLVKEIDFDVDVNGKAKLYIETCNPVELYGDDTTPWYKDIQDWVDLKVISFKEVSNG
jgi:hypothetical protein